MDSSTTSYTKSFSIDIERQNYKKKMKQRKTRRIIHVLIFWSLIIAYFITPFSRVGDDIIYGNVYLKKEEIKTILHLNENNFILLIDEKKSIDLLKAHPYIEDVDVVKSLFNIKVIVKEIFPIGVINNNSFLLSDGSVVLKDDYDYLQRVRNVPSVEENLSQQIKSTLINKLSKIDVEVREKMLSINIIEIGDQDSTFFLCDIKFFDEKIGFMYIRVDLGYLEDKFEINNYNYIINNLMKNGIMYQEDNPVFVRYDLLEVNEFLIVDDFS